MVSPVDIAIAIIGALGGTAGLIAVYDRLAYRRALRTKVTAEAERATVEVDRAEIDAAERVTEIAVNTLLGPLEKRISALTAEIAKLETYISVLVNALRTSGIPVPPHPDDTAPIE